MEAPGIALKWHRALKELRLIVKPAALKQHAVPPTDLYPSVLEIIKEREASGEIQRHELHRGRLARFWEVARRCQVPHDLVLVVASGQPQLPSTILVDKPVRGSAEAAVLLTLGGDRQVLKAIRPEWITVFIRTEMARLDLLGRPNPAAIYAAWARAAWHDESVSRQPIPYLYESERTAASWRVEPNDLNVELVIAAPVTAPGNLLAEARPLLERAFAAVGDQDGASGFCRQFKRHLYRSVRDATVGPQSIGLELPLHIAAGIGLAELQGGHGKVVTRLTTLVAGAMAGARLNNKTAWRAAPGFAFYADERQQNEERMIASGIAQRRLDGSVIMRPHVRMTNPSLRSKWSRRVHQEALLVARAAIAGVSERERDIQAVTIGLDDDQIPALVNALRAMRGRALGLASTIKQPDGIYHLATELFPLTKAGNEPSTKPPAAFDYAAWVMLVVRELVVLKDAEQTPEALAARLIHPVSTGAVAGAMMALSKNKFIRIDPATGRYVTTAKNVLTEQDGGGASLARFHEDMIDLTGHVVETADRQRSEFRGALVPVNKAALPRFRELFLGLFQFLIDLSEQRRTPSQLYQLNIRLIPLVTADS